VKTEDPNHVNADIYNFHVYLHDITPESRWSGTMVKMLNARNTYWSSVPWWNDETNFNGGNETCSSSYSLQDCTGQIVRWQLLHASNGGTNLSWFKWKSTMAEYFAYGPAYSYMMQYLMGGSFSQPCAISSGTTWTCPFTEVGGRVALFVWTTSEIRSSYTVPPGYIDYRDLNGGTTGVSGGQPIYVTVEPIMLEKPGPPANN
jgi:hypothetical protein